jgi:putative aldouronate transport system substrate-binding protein
MSSTTGWVSNPIEFIMNSFIYTTRSGHSGRYLMRDDGEVRFVANTDEWRDGLTYMADLVADGLLAPETFVQQNDQLKALVENPDYPLVGVSTAGHYGVFTVLGGETGRYADYRSFAPLEGPTGIRQAFYEPRRVSMHTKVTTAEERPDIVAQWADYFYGGLENQLLAWRYWIEGEDYRWTTEEEKKTMITRAGTPALVIPNESSQRYGLDKWNDGWVRSVPAWMPEPWEALVDIDDPANLEARLMMATRDDQRPFKSDHWMPPGIVFDPSVTDELADLTEALVSDTGLVDRWSTQFIVGERDIRDDSQWNEYVSQLDRAGLDRYVEIWATRLEEGGFLD